MGGLDVTSTNGRSNWSRGKQFYIGPTWDAGGWIYERTRQRAEPAVSHGRWWDPKFDEANFSSECKKVGADHIYTGAGKYTATIKILEQTPTKITPNVAVVGAIKGFSNTPGREVQSSSRFVRQLDP